MTDHRVCNKSDTMNVKCGEGTFYPSGSPEFTPGFSGVHIARSLVFCVMFCRWLFVLVLVLLAIVLLVIFWFTASDYPFGIIKLFLLFEEPRWYVIWRDLVVSACCQGIVLFRSGYCLIEYCVWLVIIWERMDVSTSYKYKRLYIVVY